MKFFKLYKNFNENEDGAVTVDWVVLTSAIVGLGVAVLATVSNGTKTLGGKISSNLASRTVVE
ncbi:MAG: Flp pilus assembly pilin Flp [Celeribacter sp.]|jgi:Flp pilus assembly pilin Flp